MQSKEGTTAQSVKAVAVSGLIGGVISFAVCAAALLVASALIQGELVPEGAMTPLCIAACALGGFLGACVAFRRSAGFPALCALCAGIVFCLLVLLLALLIEGRLALTGANLGALAAALAAGGAAGLMGTPKGKKKSKKRK